MKLKTHCKNGHEMTEENTRWRNGNRNGCRQCSEDLRRSRLASKEAEKYRARQREYNRRWRKKRRAKKPKAKTGAIYRPQPERGEENCEQQARPIRSLRAKTVTSLRKKKTNEPRIVDGYVTLYTCPGTRIENPCPAQITKNACAANQVRAQNARTDKVAFDAFSRRILKKKPELAAKLLGLDRCLACPGVVALSKRGETPPPNERYIVRAAGGPA